MKPIVVANWKMNTSLADASVLATLVKNQLHEIPGVNVVICPPTIWLQEVASILEVSGEHIHLGAQNCYPDQSGPYTGEVSAWQLRDLCHYCIVGHSERREHFKESSEFVADKAAAVLAAGMRPIVCVGEKNKESGSIDQVLQGLRQSIEGILQPDYKDLVIAYEPVWSISTNSNGEVATGEYANTICLKIKELVGDETPVLYGGSVNSANVQGYTSQGAIDGVLVGGASLKSKEFVEIVKKVIS